VIRNSQWQSLVPLQKWGGGGVTIVKLAEVVRIDSKLSLKVKCVCVCGDESCVVLILVEGELLYLCYN
jgi:hypothetical protein